MNIVSKIKTLGKNKGVKIAAGVVGAAALGYGAYKIGKKFLGSKKTRKSSATRLRNKAIIKSWKIKNIQLDRKLIKEQLKI